MTETKRQVWSDLKQVRERLDSLRKPPVQPEQADLFESPPVI